MRTRRLILPVLIGAALVLSGCSGADSGGGSDADYATSDGGAAYDAAPEPAANEEQGESAAAPGSTAVTTRQVIVTGYLTMTVDDPRASAAEVARIAEEAGGWVESRSERAGSARLTATADLTVRIPSGAMSHSLTKIEALGDVSQFDQDTDDVTSVVQDLDARIRALELSVDRLEAMLENASTTQEVINAEQTLTDRQAQLESLQTHRLVLGEQVAMSTLHVALVTPQDAPPEEKSGFLAGLESSWNALVTSANALIHVLGILVPWAAIAGLITWLALVLSRRYRARNPKPVAPAWPGAYPAPAPAPPERPMAAPAQPAPAQQAPAQQAPAQPAPQPSPASPSDPAPPTA